MPDQSATAGPDFLADDAEAIADDGLIHGEADAEAFVLVTPVGVVVAEEKVVAGNDEDAALLTGVSDYRKVRRTHLNPLSICGKG